MSTFKNIDKPLDETVVCMRLALHDSYLNYCTQYFEIFFGAIGCFFSKGFVKNTCDKQSK